MNGWKIIMKILKFNLLFFSLFSNYYSSVSDKLLIYISPNLTKNVHTDLKDIL